MGIRVSRHHDLLDGSEWLRTVAQNHQKTRGGVAGFEKFTIEPAVTYSRGSLSSPSASSSSEVNSEANLDLETIQDGGVRLRAVTVEFRNGKDNSHSELNWIVKSAVARSVHHHHHKSSSAEVTNLLHEIKVYVSLLPEVTRFLEDQLNPRAKHLLNIPEYVHHERDLSEQGGQVLSCHLVLENVAKTKNCSPIAISYLEEGLPLAQFRVYTGTLAQFHAVGLAFNCSRRHSDESDLLDTFPFLHRNRNRLDLDPRERDRCLALYEKLLRWRQRCGSNRTTPMTEDDFRRRLKLVTYFRNRGSELVTSQQERSRKSVLKGLCLGPTLANEVQFQSERSTGHPVCAAVTSCHRVHYGDIVLEFALSFFALAHPSIRREAMVSVIQSYCHVLTTTLELLEVNWIRQYQVNFSQFLTHFQECMAMAMIRAIVIHMSRTNPHELDKLTSKSSKSNSDGSTLHPKKLNSQMHLAEDTGLYFIPLTERRINFLLSLTDTVLKIV